ncbi:hypothetical protein QBC33DRAFT_574211 [Phialemonium atrogriseum]|uniref:Clr5 domain-containing protein n=1 Tax=Phialemonium atrogriseum TaxID=1093897 RepID=A0AAJ0BQM1_9PEZI|nr:uncharacterized protein QBC33DRAFT_574211 [Phialemonium atrogriseum]KAK1762466.1 hypothetical protein QBC33DRAFT_574211 [Phialemonium atrogriseum]
MAEHITQLLIDLDQQYDFDPLLPPELPTIAFQDWPPPDQQLQYGQWEEEIAIDGAEDTTTAPLGNFLANAPIPAERPKTPAFRFLETDPVANITPGMQKKQRAPAKTEQEWALVRQRITELYKTKPLSVVMDDVKEKFQFEATVRQFKSQIRKWGLNKNVREPEMGFIVRKQQEREKGQSAELSQANLRFRVRGEAVPQAKIDRWKRSHNVADHASPQFESTPSDVSYSTVSPRLSPERLSSEVDPSLPTTQRTAYRCTDCLRVGRLDLAAILTRYRDCLDCGDKTTAEAIFGDIIEALQRDIHPLDYSLVQGVFGGKGRSCDEIDSRFEKIISLREEQFGDNHHLTHQARLAFVDIILGMLREQIEKPDQDRKTMARRLEVSRCHLHRILRTALSEEVVLQLFRVVCQLFGPLTGEHDLTEPDEDLTEPDEDLTEPDEDPWYDYSFVETIVAACSRNPDVQQAFVYSCLYGWSVFTWDIDAIVQQLVREGHAIGQIGEDGQIQGIWQNHNLAGRVLADTEGRFRYASARSSGLGTCAGTATL